jgi:hypothetical protein
MELDNARVLAFELEQAKGLIAQSKLAEGLACLLNAAAAPPGPGRERLVDCQGTAKAAVKGLQDDLYLALCSKRDCSPEDLKRNYRKLVLQVRPPARPPARLPRPPRA